MIYYVTYLKDRLGNNYLGVNVPNEVVKPFLERLESILGDRYEDYRQYKEERDGSEHHITVVNVSDYNKFIKEGMDRFINSVEKVLRFEIDDLKLMGIGTASKNENRTFFVVCQSDKLESIREMWGLPEHHFHITIGFNKRDVFGVPKNQVLKKDDRFLQLLSQKFYKNENWEFIKDISNYEFNPDLEIIPISIEDKYMKFKVGDYYIVIGYSEDNDELIIYSEFKSDSEIKRMPQAEIVKFLKNNIL